MHAVLHGIAVFFHHLAAVRWRWLGIGVCCHFCKLIVISRAWRNVVKDAYPAERVRWPGLFGAYVAGTGVSSIVPIRGGEAVKLFIAKRRIPGATYTTLAATVVLTTLFDALVAGCFLLWAIYLGVLPGLNILPHLPSFDFGWFFRHPAAGAVIGGFVLLGLSFAGVWIASRVRGFKRRVAQGFSVLRNRRRYLRRVVAWQVADWTLRLTTVFFFLRAFNVASTVHNALLVQVSQSLATVLPFSPGGIGTEQAFLLYIFRRRASRSAALSFSVGMRVTLIVVNAALGFVAIMLMLKTLRFRKAVEADRATEPKRD